MRGSVELFAVDLSGQRAILHMEERWFLISSQRQWHPLEVRQEQALFLSSSMAPIRQHFGTFEGVVAEVLRLCAGYPPKTSAASTWDEKLPALIRRYSRSLDQFFEGRGCSGDAAFQLSLECFLRLSDLGPVEEEDVSWLLHQLASELRPLVHTHPGGSEDETSGVTGGSPNALDGRRLRKILGEADVRALRCLYFWGALRCSHQETAWLVKLSIDEVRTRLVQMATRLGRSADQLRAPDLVEACIQEVKGR